MYKIIKLILIFTAKKKYLFTELTKNSAGRMHMHISKEMSMTLISDSYSGKSYRNIIINFKLKSA